MQSQDKHPHWNAVCKLDQILPDTGVAALVAGKPVAIFRLKAEQRLYALDNLDPNSQASVLSRGLVGNLGERLVVASPIYKHHFDLESGECLEAPENSVSPWPVKVVDETVYLAAPHL
jgi:nitrite reductase (NADH) small subunit